MQLKHSTSIAGRRLSISIAATLVLLWIATGSLALDNHSSQTNSASLATSSPVTGVLAQIYISGSRFGEIGPCSCVGVDYGGVDREVIIMEEHLREGAQHLRLDAGGFTAPLFIKGQGLRATYALKALGALGIQYVNVGWSDLALGKKNLIQTAQENRLQLLSANVVDAKTGKRIFKPLAVIEPGAGNAKSMQDAKSAHMPDTAGSKPPQAGSNLPDRAGRILVVGVTNDYPQALRRHGYYQERVKQDFRILDPARALQEVLDAERKAGDLVIVLAFFDRLALKDNRASVKIFEKMSGIDLVLLGFHYFGKSQSSFAGETPVHTAGFQGRFFQNVLITADTQGRPRIGQVEEVKIPSKYKRDPQLRLLVDEYKQKTDTALAGDPAQSTSGGRDDAELVAYVAPNRFVGAKQCMGCHDSIVESWRQTRHSSATQTLIKEKREKDIECLVCHSTGLRTGMVYDLENRQHLEGVQCESCHGQGYQHVREQQRLRLIRAVPGAKKPTEPEQEHPMLNTFSAASCIGCHDTTNDPDFDYSSALKKISHRNLVRNGTRGPGSEKTN